MEELNPEPFDRQLFEITWTDGEQTGNHLNCRSTGSREPCAISAHITTLNNNNNTHSRNNKDTQGTYKHMSTRIHTYQLQE